ncbi:MAG: hypothetical protein GTO43_00230, partial [Armatimonadetes bacterium]|nr:hypothetical protein [Armatimonadota bacterium]
KDMITDAISGDDVDTAQGLLDLFDPYPICPQVSACRLQIAQKLLAQHMPYRAAELLQQNVDFDPWGREAPLSMELLADILTGTRGLQTDA